MSAVYSDLANMPVLITGGASGIGEALVAAFAAQKARVAAIDAAEQSSTRSAASSC
jgi:NAD(P)-dependent dehydrogenase (short-subunit alcohol dehydrogenase family)